jgi:hypothetical protein
MKRMTVEGSTTRPSAQHPFKAGTVGQGKEGEALEMFRAMYMSNWNDDT